VNHVLGVLAIAGTCALVVGLLGYLAVRLLAPVSLTAATAVVPVATVLAFVVGLVATSLAMFLSHHDLGVALLVSAVAGVMSVAVGLALGMRVRAEQQRAAAQAEQLAALQREAAVEASRRDLVAQVSHDLRTPLAGLRAMAEALEDGVATDPERYYHQIRVEVDRLATMVDDLFELARIQAGALQLTLEKVSVDELVSDAVAAADPHARSRGVRLVGHSATGDLVQADERELHRALANLVLNAIRYTPADGVVEVTAADEPGAVVLSVSDACGGIAPDDLPHVFDVAWRGSRARTPGPDTGAGLGLAIVRGIVEAHHGQVSVHNDGPGCRFEVRLPVVAAPSTA
jgi:signal transduction histidine kinase